MHAVGGACRLQLLAFGLDARKLCLGWIDHPRRQLEALHRIILGMNGKWYARPTWQLQVMHARLCGKRYTHHGHSALSITPHQHISTLIQRRTLQIPRQVHQHHTPGHGFFLRQGPGDTARQQQGQQERKSSHDEPSCWGGGGWMSSTTQIRRPAASSTTTRSPGTT